MSTMQTEYEGQLPQAPSVDAKPHASARSLTQQRQAFTWQRLHTRANYGPRNAAHCIQTTPCPMRLESRNNLRNVKFAFDYSLRCGWEKAVISMESDQTIKDQTVLFISLKCIQHHLFRLRIRVLIYTYLIRRFRHSSSLTPFYHGLINHLSPFKSNFITFK